MTEYTFRLAHTMALVSSQNVYTLPVTVSIRAGIFPIRLIMADVVGGLTGTGSGVDTASASISRYSASAISGGNLLTPADCREGSVPASATIRYRTATYNAGTGVYTPGSAVTVSGTATEITQLNQDKDWKPPSEIVVAPGSVLHLKGVNPYTSGTPYNPVLLVAEVWFDEERVSRSS